MNWRRLALLLLALLAMTVGLRSKAEEPTDSSQIDDLISHLGDDLFANREAAELELQTIGESALPQLTAAATNRRLSLEIRLRTHRLVQRVTAAACRSPTTGMQFVLLPAGEFDMGSPPKEPDRRDDETQHRVAVTRPFMLAAHEVTQAEYRQVTGAEPSWFAATGEGNEKVVGQSTDGFPVESVSWFDAVAFCNAFSRRDGLQPYYRLTNATRDQGSIVSAEVQILSGQGYRLPTEAEWEYACRAGTSQAFQFGDSRKHPGGNFKYRGASVYGSRPSLVENKRPLAVGSYAPNLWGFYDMHGNVAEWCGDWYDKAYYENSPARDPSGPPHGDHRVLRGGSWLVSESSCRAATRFWQSPREGKFSTGFRVARNPSRFLSPPNATEETP